MGHHYNNEQDIRNYIRSVKSDILYTIGKWINHCYTSDSYDHKIISPKKCKTRKLTMYIQLRCGWFKIILYGLLNIFLNCFMDGVLLNLDSL